MITSGRPTSTPEIETYVRILEQALYCQVRWGILPARNRQVLLPGSYNELPVTFDYCQVKVKPMTCPELPGPFASTFNCLQGTFDYLPGTFDYLPGTFDHLPDNFDYLPGTFDHCQATVKSMTCPELQPAAMKFGCLSQ